MKLAGLTANPGSNREMTLGGILTTADIEDSDRIEKMVSAKLAGKEQKVEWQHATDGRRHDFKVDRIARHDKGGSLHVSWSGAPIAVEKKGEETIDVPAARCSR